MSRAKKQDCILLFMPYLNMGGAEKQFLLLREGLIENKVRVITILTSSNSEGKNESVFSLKVNANLIEKELEIIKVVKNISKENNIKCAIVYEKYAQFSIPFFKFCGIKTLFSERNSGEHKSLISRKVICMADIITVNSKNALEVMSKYVRKKIFFIPNGVELKENADKPVVNFVKPLKILVPARIDPVKNQMLVVKAFETNDSVEIHFAGKINDKKYFETIQNYLVSKSLNNRIIYDGFVTDIYSYYKKFDIVLLPSLSEGTSNVILEAFAMKKICIASDIEMNKSIISKKELLFKSNNAKDLEDTVMNFFDMEKKNIRDIIDDCYEYVKVNYSVNNMVNRYLELLNG